MRISNVYNSDTKILLHKLVTQSTKSCNSLTTRSSEEVYTWLEKNLVYYAVESQQILGWIVKEPINNKTAELKALYVMPEFRRKGLANRLIKASSNQEGTSFICATKTQDTHSILSSNGFDNVRLLSLPINVLIDYARSRKLESVIGSLGTKITYWYKTC